MYALNCLQGFSRVMTPIAGSAQGFEDIHVDRVQGRVHSSSGGGRNVMVQLGSGHRRCSSLTGRVGSGRVRTVMECPP